LYGFSKRAMISENYKNRIKESIRKKFEEMGVDEETINELASVSIESLENELSKIEDILKGDDISELGFHTHTIKGVLLNVGLNDDAERFREIKHLVEAGKTEEEIKEITKERISIFFQ
jgi:HPt (histidine-containing phosphotransfer) domain-containing protein